MEGFNARLRSLNLQAIQNQWGLLWTETTYLKQHFRQPWGLETTGVFQPKKPCSTCSAQPYVTLLWACCVAWPCSSLPCPLSSLRRPILNCLILLLPWSLFLSRALQVCPSLHVQDCPECLTPSRHGTSVCWLNTPDIRTQAWGALVGMERKGEVLQRAWREP